MEYSTFYSLRPFVYGEFAFNGSYKISSNNSEFVNLKGKAIINEDKFKRIIVDSVKNMAKRSNIIIEVSDIARVSYESETNYSYSKKNKHLTMASLTKTIGFDRGYQSDIIVITVK